MDQGTLNAVFAGISILLTLGALYLVFKLGTAIEKVAGLLEIAAFLAAKTETKVDDEIVAFVKSFLEAKKSTSNPQSPTSERP